ncbi:MAG: histidine phosphatase family protein [Victivallaceae bacterium]
MKIVYLIRHGSLPEHCTKGLVGSSDVPLSELGVAESKALGRYLDKIKFDCIFSSPLQRAVATCQNALPGREFVRDERLREINFGDWEKLTFDEVQQLDPVNCKKWMTYPEKFGFPNGENMDNLSVRVKSFKEQLWSTSGDTLAVFSHGGVLRRLLVDLLDLRPDLAFHFNMRRGSVSIVHLHDDNSVTLEKLNYYVIADGALQ